MPTPIIGTLPVILTNGTIADATQVMADFNYILAQVNANGAPATGGLYLALTGGTLTGNLTAPNILLNNAAGIARNLFMQTGGLNRWNLGVTSTPEGGSNAGSDFVINRYADNGTFIDMPLGINRASGAVSLTGNLSITTVGPTLTLSAAASGQARSFIGATAGSNRWIMQLGSGTAESGSNAGSDFTINRYTDASTLIDTPLTITRSSGVVTAGGATGANLAISAPAATSRTFSWQTNGLNRFYMQADTSAEGGSNAGSNFAFNAATDAGATLGSVFSVVRSTRVVTFAVAIVNGPSDRSLKENIAPLAGSLDKVLALKGVSFNFKTSPKKEIGLIAQDVAEVVPEVIQPYESGEAEGKNLLAVDYPKLVAVLIESIKELTARVASLEAKVQST